MPTLRDWEDYIELEEELNLEESNKKGHKNNVKRDKKNSWSNHPTRI